MDEGNNMAMCCSFYVLVTSLVRLCAISADRTLAPVVSQIPLRSSSRVKTLKRTMRRSTLSPRNGERVTTSSTFVPSLAMLHAYSERSSAHTCFSLSLGIEDG
jgi:hypothetical protein